MHQPINLLIADDHALIREGLRKILSIEPGINVVGEVADGQQAVDFCHHNQVDIVLMDINMPVMNGIEACRKIKESKPHIGIIALTIHDQDEYLFELIKYGIAGYVLKDVHPDQLVKTIQGVARGESFIPPAMTARVLAEFSRLSCGDHTEKKHHLLTEREIEVLKQVAKGQSNKAIAKTLFISEKTVKNHLTSIFNKIGVEDRTQAALYAIKEKLVEI
ncbi:response regulator [Desulforamulus hydrothermalis]|uniref:Stage 0 sporulation protein A homolog n=1 Tax=Desulforamulus hydrothermalis Lam5 = DSM 18033 TaxID=1121428 RepID=K8DWY9_9FIRM|nr:response regulator transcription factor [Desulforamulus hydrothermalis]CCO07032.1 Transcriptional regulatory protein degU [Desulforamulus hydrothermalis Lam5 = DSM 18033]SHG97169.1 two component transcriptional regulator, LuxR family [Desulforamulus hydrothermalis Lam5 = DSM 18033]